MNCNVIGVSRWVWSEAGAQLELESALDVGGFGYPAMAVINARKMKYSILRGAFSRDGINEFLRYVFLIFFFICFLTFVEGIYHMAGAILLLFEDRNFQKLSQ